MISPHQCRAARVLLGVSAGELASRAGIGLATVKRFESGQPVQAATVDAVASALAGSGIVFVAEGEASPGGGPGVRLAAS